MGNCQGPSFLEFLANSRNCLEGAVFLICFCSVCFVLILVHSQMHQSYPDFSQLTQQLTSTRLSPSVLPLTTSSRSFWKSKSDTKIPRRHKSVFQKAYVILDAAWLRFALYWVLQLSDVSGLSLALFEHLICEAIGDADLPPDTQHLGLAMQGSLVLSRRWVGTAE